MVKKRERIAAALNTLSLPGCSFDLRETVLVCGSSRSGTTWLGQVLSASEDRCLVTEPLHPKMPGLLRAGFTWRTYIDPSTEWPEGRAILDRVFRGQGVTVKLLHRNGRKVFTSDRLVIKTVRACRLLPWLARRFPIRGTVFLIRHPCAVISSQVSHFSLGGEMVWPDNLDYLERKMPHLLPLARSLETEEERRALTWSLDQHAPLSATGPEPWIRVSYEKLVMEGRPELERICAALGVDASPEALRMLDRNSAQTQRLSVDHSRASVEERLTVWKERLSGRQVKRILSVVEACGIRGFSEDPVPAFEGIGLDRRRESGRGETSGPSPGDESTREE